MNKECSTCGGTGQVGFFQGVSRFLLSWEECPQCCGTGLVSLDDGSTDIQKQDIQRTQKKAKKKKKS